MRGFHYLFLILLSTENNLIYLFCRAVKMQNFSVASVCLKLGFVQPVSFSFFCFLLHCNCCKLRLPGLCSLSNIIKFHVQPVLKHLSFPVSNLTYVFRIFSNLGDIIALGLEKLKGFLFCHMTCNLSPFISGTATRKYESCT